MSLRSYENDGETLIRFIAFTDVPVIGFYQFNDCLQIFSLPDDAPRPEYALGEHPFIIEYLFEEMPQSGVTDDFDSRMIQSQFHFRKQQEIINILSVITRHLINKEKSGRQWVINDTNGNFLSTYSGLGYFWRGLIDLNENITNHDLTEIPLIDGNDYYSQHAEIGNPFNLCNATTELLTKYLILDDDKKEAFLSASVLFSQAAETWAVSHSLAYVGFISSLEALIEIENKDTKIPRYQDTIMQ